MQREEEEEAMEWESSDEEMEMDEGKAKRRAFEAAKEDLRRAVSHKNVSVGEVQVIEACER